MSGPTFHRVANGTDARRVLEDPQRFLALLFLRARCRSAVRRVDPSVCVLQAHRRRNRGLSGTITTHKKKCLAHYTCHSEACLPSARWRRWRCLVSSRRGNFNDAMPGDLGRPLLTSCVSNFVPSERRADKQPRMETALQRRRLSPSVPGRNAREKPYGRSAKAS